MNSVTLKGLNDLLEVVARLSDNPTFLHARCLENILMNWASAGGMDFATSMQAEFERQWALSCIGIALLKFKATNYQFNDVIKHWLLRLLDKMEAFHVQNKIRNNHAAWAALSAGSISYFFGSEKHWEWALDRHRSVLDQVQQNGTLPLELHRDVRASNYHLFTATPLLVFRKIVKCRIVKDQNGDEFKLLENLILSIKHNKQILSDLSGYKQIEINDSDPYFVLTNMSDADIFYPRLGGSVATLRLRLSNCFDAQTRIQ